METRTPGAAGGPGKRTGRKAGTAPRSDPTTLSYRDVEELLAERGVEVGHTTVFRWVLRFTPLLTLIRGSCLSEHGRGRFRVDEDRDDATDVGKHDALGLLDLNLKRTTRRSALVNSTMHSCVGN